MYKHPFKAMHHPLLHLPVINIQAQSHGVLINIFPLSAKKANRVCSIYMITLPKYSINNDSRVIVRTHLLFQANILKS